MAKAWKGRLPGGTDPRVERFTESIHFDRRLFREDVQASTAHAKMLAAVGLLTDDEAERIAKTLAEIETEIAEERFAFDIGQEDIHTHIENALIARLGDVGRKLHTARSRNDQVVTDLKLWIRARLEELDRRLADLQLALVGSAERHEDVILPAYTHLQRAQPVLAAHYFLAFVEKFERDRGRAADCRERVNVLPLGSAALAGTSLPIDRQRVADALGFSEIAANSLDVAGDRDFVLETVFVLTLIAEHLSAWAEDGILWSTTEFGFLRIPDDFCTGSSIMPHKKNPDVLELIRGKCARVIGSLQTLLVLVKGLPTAYNRDLQEDKPPLFDAMDTVLTSLELAAAIAEQSTLDRERIASRIHEGHLDATTLMEQMIRSGAPMRSAHEAVGTLVRRAVEQGCSLADLGPAAFEEVLAGHGADLHGSLGIENAVAAFRSFGSTAPNDVRERIRHWKHRLANQADQANQADPNPIQE